MLKRQVTLIKRLLWRTLDVVQRMTPATGRAATLFHDVQENIESFHFYADELLDDANTVLNIQLALAAHRTGEVMRILTVFSVFFLPLTFLVGVYGMNFDYMPELRSRWGYPLVLAAMGGITLMIYMWFRRRGWLDARHHCPADGAHRNRDHAYPGRPPDRGEPLRHRIAARDRAVRRRRRA